MEKIGTKENFIRLVKQYQNLVFSICLKLTGDYFAAEDLAQDTFLSVYEHWKEFDGKDEKAWICRIASNKSIDYLRKQNRVIQAGSAEETEAASISGGFEDGPEKTYSNQLVMQQFSEACGRLKEPYSGTATAYFIEGLTAREIAGREGCPLKTIQSRIHRAREHLKQFIRKEDLLS